MLVQQPPKLGVLGLQAAELLLEHSTSVSAACLNVSRKVFGCTLPLTSHPAGVPGRAASAFRQTMSAPLHPAPRSPRREMNGCVLAALLFLLPLPPLLLPVYLVIDFAIQTVHVVGAGMEPAARSGDYLVADKLALRLHAPARGDIVTFRDPADPGRDLIKRVVGLPGERLLVSGCAVFVDGHRLAEPYVRGWSDCSATWPADGQPARLGLDAFFVMGDNRDHSRDSRELGPIARDQIEAQARFRVLPLWRP